MNFEKDRFLDTILHKILPSISRKELGMGNQWNHEVIAEINYIFLNKKILNELSIKKYLQFEHYEKNRPLIKTHTAKCEIGKIW